MRRVVSCSSTSFPWRVFFEALLCGFKTYMKMDVTRECISFILELREILLTFQTVFNLVNLAVVYVTLKSISGLEPLSFYN